MSCNYIQNSKIEVGWINIFTCVVWTVLCLLKKNVANVLCVAVCDLKTSYKICIQLYYMANIAKYILLQTT